jgi:hypothetical protein
VARTGAGEATRENTEAVGGGTGVPCWVFGRFDVASVWSRIQRVSDRAGQVPQAYLFDRQGWSTLFAGILLLMISFTTNYGDDNLLQISALSVHDKGLF